MLERGDLITLHEPFLYLYYLQDAKKELDYFDPDPDQPRSYEAVREHILEMSEQGIVFVKDMSYYVADYIHSDHEFVRRVKNTFLIRDPRRSIASYYKADKQVTCEEIGLETEYRHFKLAWELTGEVPVVIDADDLQDDPEGTLRAYCQALGLAFAPESLAWDDAVPPSWQHVAGWHSDLADSKGLVKRKTPGKPAVDVNSIPVLKAYYDHHLPFYEKMHTHRIHPTP